VQVRGASPPFSAITDQVTLSSVLDYIDPAPPLIARSPIRLFSQTVIGVTGGRPAALASNHVTGTSIVYLSAATHLPVAFDWRAAGSATAERWRFSSWGERVAIPTPHQAKIYD